MEEIARVLQPGGTFFSQQVDAASVFELLDDVLGQRDSGVRPRQALHIKAAAEAAGLEILDLRREPIRTEFHDVGAVIYFLRKMLGKTSTFSVDRYRAELQGLHERIQTDGSFIAHPTRTLIEARKPA